MFTSRQNRQSAGNRKDHPTVYAAWNERNQSGAAKVVARDLAFILPFDPPHAIRSFSDDLSVSYTCNPENAPHPRKTTKSGRARLVCGAQFTDHIVDLARSALAKSLDVDTPRAHKEAIK